MDLNNLKAQASNDPMTAITVGALAITAIAKLLDASSAAKGRRAYAKQVNHSIKRSKK